MWFATGMSVSRRHGGEGRAARRRFALWSCALLLCGAVMAAAPLKAGAAALQATYPVTVGEKAVVTNTGGDPIRIREGAGTEYARLAWAYEGQIVSVLAGPVTDDSAIRWFRVRATSATGWMMAQYLAGVAPSPSSAPSPTAQPTQPTQPTLSGRARVANTDGDPLRVRSQPNTAGSVLARLSPGTLVEVEGGPVTDSAGITWYKIRAGSVSGWAMAQYLAQEPASDQSRGAPPQAEPVSSAPPPPSPSPTSTLAQYRQWMEEARALYPYPQSVDKMWRVMMCESSGNPNASGGGGRWLGLFQYAPSTWAGSWNPYRGNSIWDAKSQIFATAKAWSIGMQNHWSCF